MKIFNQVSASVLAASFAFVFMSPTALFAASPASVNLGSAGNFTILAKTGISTTGTTSVVGDIGVSPAAATYITGFSLSLPAASAFSTSPLVSGKVYAPGYADPTSTMLTTAIGDMQTAYTDAQGRTSPAPVTELGAGNIGGMTLAPGLYKWGTGVIIPTDVTLSGSATDVWIFQIAQNLNISSATKINLSGGAQVSNIFWAVAGQTTIGTTAVFNGNILDQTAIVVNTGAVVNGRLLAQTAVTLDSNAVTASTPAQAASSSSASASVAVTVPSASTMAQTVASPTPSASTASAGTAYATPSQTTVATSVMADRGCFNGNKFSIVTGRNCAGASSMVSLTATTDIGCVSGNKFSTVSGKNCNSQAGMNTMMSASSNSNFGQQVRAIARNMGKGSKNGDVKTLQMFLISQNKGVAAQSLAKVSSTGVFGEMTRKALAEFQASVGISPSSGAFGPKTRAYLMANY